MGHPSDYIKGTVVVAQLVERLLPALENCNSNTLIDNFYLLAIELKRERERGREWPILM